MKYDFASNKSDMKEALQNVRLLNQNGTQQENIQSTTKTTMVANMVNTNDEDTAITEIKELVRKQDSQNSDPIPDDYCLPDDKLV